MIQKDKANLILNLLLGTLETTFTPPSALYLGLCATKPNEDGELTKYIENETVSVVGEPYIFSDEEKDQNNYKRLKIMTRKGTTDSNGKTTYSVTNNYFGMAADGEVKNDKDEIKFNAAIKSWDKMVYWFITEKEKPTNGEKAILWGTIKDIIQEDQIIQLSNNTPTLYTYSDLITLKPSTKYIVNWNGTDKEIESSEIKVGTDGDTQYNYLELNCINSSGEVDKDYPFKIKYWVNGDALEGFSTNYEIIGYLKEDEIATGNPVERKFGIYGIGIDIKRNTVPTFFKNQLVASIDLDSE